MRDYYDILGLSPSANDDELKAAYRKAALRWHPDRNFGNVEEATREFADAQTAYELLSDVNERAWYDRHKDAILRGDDAGEGGRDEDDVAGLSSHQLMAYFSVVTSASLDDSAHGFFTSIRKLFDTIIAEEIEACTQQDIDAPRFATFGGSQTDDHDVRTFYSFWSTFNSSKTFFWAEKYAYHRAPDRRVRRAMEKENAKLRQNERKEYNEVVHKLISYMKKRDYRFIAKPQMSAAQRQQELLEARKAQAEASRAANLSQMDDFKEQDWQKVDHRQVAEDEMQAFEEWETEIECVACSKTFKSEKQYASHEKSKKHIQTVKRLRWELKKEAMELGLDYDSEESFATADEGEPDPKGPPSEQDTRLEGPGMKTESEDPEPSTLQIPSRTASTRPASLASGDEYGSRADFEARLEAELEDLALDISDPEEPVAKSAKKSNNKKKKEAMARKKNRG